MNIKFTISILSLYLFTTGVHSKVGPTKAESTRVGPIAQFVWHQAQGDSRTISLASFDGESWGQPIEVYITDQPIWSVTIGSDQRGNQLLVWTELHKNTSVLMQKSYQASSRVWSDAALLSNYGTENIGATVLFDLQNRAWVVWAESSTGQSDIVAIHREPGMGWSHPVQVNEINQVPDIAPNASLNKNGDVTVAWSAYNVDKNDYVMHSKTISTNNRVAFKQQRLAADTLLPESVPTPEFAPKIGASTIHFPNNLMIQSRTVSAKFKPTTEQ